MRKLAIVTILVFLILPLVAVSRTKSEPIVTRWDRSQGYYKDVFMDSGLALTSRRSLPVCRTLGLEMEYFASASTSRKSRNPANEVDTLLQDMIIGGNPIDENGVLLYPDGAPRFRMIYVNGGHANRHGSSLTQKGLDRLRQFVQSGGSYVGSCAGAFFAATYKCSNDSILVRDAWSNVWPGCVIGTKLMKARPTIEIEKDCPLLRYGLQPGTTKVDSVYHNGGCYADVDHMWPEGTEILARFRVGVSDKRHDLDSKPVIWAYKASATTGRVIPCGSHPEGIAQGPRLDLMVSMFRYAMDGNPMPQVKGEIVEGERRMMNLATQAGDPSHTRIGDRQYHHFTITVPKGCASVDIVLEEVRGWHDFDLYLYASSETFAFSDTAKYRNVENGVGKRLSIPNPAPGVYHVSVFCATTVDTVETKYGPMYTGRIDVLNGVPYSLSVEFTPRK